MLYEFLSRCKAGCFSLESTLLFRTGAEEKPECRAAALLFSTGSILHQADLGSVSEEAIPQHQMAMDAM